MMVSLIIEDTIDRKQAVLRAVVKNIWTDWEFAE